MGQNMRYTIKRAVIGILINIILLVVIHSLFFFLYQFQGPEISDSITGEIRLSDSTDNRNYFIVPKEMEDFGFFDKATSGAWLNTLPRKNNSILLDDVDFNNVRICCENDNQEYIEWDVSYDIYGEFYFLANPQKTDFSIKEYTYTHSWRLLPIFTFFVLISLLTYRFLGSNLIMVDVILLALYTVFLWIRLF